MAAVAPVAEAPQRTRRRAGPIVIAVIEALAVVALIAFLTRLTFLHPRGFRGDLINDAWYIQHQAHALSTTHAASLTLTSQSAAFYPIFAFYGGTLFVVGAILSLLAGGSAYAAEAIIYIAALAAAYGGWYWLARMAGVQRWFAHAPGLVYVTAPYVLTNVNVRQDLVETVATAAMPLMVASAISVGRSDRLRAGPTAALAASAMAFTGSHNLTLLWGTIFLFAGGAIVALVVPEARGLIPRRGALRILAVVAPAVAVNAWFLLPDLYYAHHTAIAQRLDDARGLLRAPADVLSPSHLLTPGRPDDGDGAGYTLPILALAWALLAVAVLRTRRRSPWARLTLVWAASALAIAALMGQAHVLAELPSPFVLLQSGGRLDTYALFAICGALVAALALVRRPPGWLAALLAAILAANLALAIHQVDNVTLTWPAPDVTLEGTTTFGLGDYADGTSPIIVPPKKQDVATITHDSVTGDRAELQLVRDRGDMFLTNLMVPAAMLNIQGAHVVGRWDAGAWAPGWQHRWFLVLESDEGRGNKPHTIVISLARSWPIVAGKVISLLGLFALLAIAIGIGVRARRARPEAPAPPPHPQS